MNGAACRFGLCVVVGALAVGFHSTLSGQQTPQESRQGLRAAAGLEATLWASEPALANPTNMAIDERGRVWVLEAVNYRRRLRRQPDVRPEGDRIVILEDTDGDGRADASKVFDQHPDIRAPLGIAVLGDRVIVSQSPNLTVYTKDASDRILRKEVLLTGWGGDDHDHGLHAVVFGPDGRYYFNAGNEGYDVTDRSGRRVQSPRGGGPASSPADWGPGRFFEGAAMAVNPDGTGLEVIAQNFRNPYELAIDAFGDIWQTDNDDDGNAWTRVNYVMAGGNYGFRGPNGRTWQEDGGTHFHQELPGVVPNMLRLGPGSPCGLVVYEGTLLPEMYRGQLLHAEAGRRLIARYPVLADGAGFTTRIEEVLHGGADTWFRPSDVAVAPDGSVFIADWYDPAVGGHGTGDPQGTRGRIFRLAPRGHRASPPAVDLQSAAGLTAAFGSPAQAVFFLAHSELTRRGPAARPLLESMWKGGDAVRRARALWMLGPLGPEGLHHAHDALRDPDPRVRILGLRVLRRAGVDVLTAARPLLHDPSAQVRREIAILLQDAARMTPAYLVGEQSTPPPALLDALVELATQYDGKDRWYLEAVGIAARGREDALYARLRQLPLGSAVLGRLLWELRAPASLPAIVATLENQAVDLDARLLALDALAAMASPDAARGVEAILVSGTAPASLVERAFAHYRRQLFSLWPEAQKSPRLPAVMSKAFATPALQATAVQLASALGDAQYAPGLMALARSPGADETVRAAAIDAVAIARDPRLLPELEQLWQSGPPAVQLAAVHALGWLRLPDLEARAQTILSSTASNEARSEAVRILARTPAGLDAMAALETRGAFPPELKRLATGLVHGSVRGSASPGPANGPAPSPEARAAAAAAMKQARERTARVFPALVATGNASIPTVRQMEQDFRVDPTAGRQVFEGTCGACHSLGGPRLMGPDLSAIGTKFDRQALLDAIVMPSAAIAFGYESWVLETTSHGTVTGLLVENTPERVTVKVDATQDVRLKPAAITARKAIPFSTMPEGLVNAMTPQQIADLIGFLATLTANGQR